RPVHADFDSQEADTTRTRWACGYVLGGRRFRPGVRESGAKRESAAASARGTEARSTPTGSGRGLVPSRSSGWPPAHSESSASETAGASARRQDRRETRGRRAGGG